MTDDLTKPTLITPDFSVDANGKAWISQRKLSELCGLGKNAINDLIRRNPDVCGTVNLNENKQLDAESAYSAALYYAKRGNETAFDLVTATGKAGFTALIYIGIHHSSLQKHLSSRHPNLMLSKGISPEIMQQAAKHYAFKSYD